MYLYIFNQNYLLLYFIHYYYFINHRYYPIVLIVCWTAGTFNRIYTIFEEHEVWMVAIHVFFGGLQGFLNALVYGANENVKLKITGIFRKLLGGCLESQKRRQASGKPELKEKLLLPGDISTLSDQEKGLFEQGPEIRINSNNVDSNEIEPYLSSQEDTTNITAKVYSRSEVVNPPEGEGETDLKLHTQSTMHQIQKKGN